MKDPREMQLKGTGYVRKAFIIGSALVLMLFCQPTQAHAWVSVGVGFGGRGHHRDFSVRERFPLHGYYDYNDYYAPYYQPVAYSYVVQSAPLGAVVYAIPAGSRQFIINGTTYYEYNGTYYLPVAGGYQVAAPPVYVQPAAVAAPSPVVTVSPEDFTVNVPNGQGGYTAVTIKKTGNGFTGPQGEYYAEFPKVAQLQAMYGKQ